MPYRKKSNISRKLPLVTRSTVAIFDRVGMSGDAVPVAASGIASRVASGTASGIGGAIARGIDAGILQQGPAFEGHDAPHPVSQDAAVIAIAGIAAARGRGRAVEVLGAAFALALARHLRDAVARNQDHPQQS